MRRRLLLALLFVVSLAGGLWWNSTPKPLNDAEKRLVGVWVGTSTSGKEIAIALLADRTEVVFTRFQTTWIDTPFYEWEANSGELTLRTITSYPGGLLKRLGWKVVVMLYGDRRDATLVHLPDGGIEMHFFDEKWTLHRTGSPELLAIFDRLSGAEPP